MNHAVLTRNSFTRNIKRSPVVNGYSNDGNTKCDVDTLYLAPRIFILIPHKAFNFKRYMPLVMEHCHASVVKTANHLGEDSISSKRTLNLDSFFSCFINSRNDLFLLFMPK